MCVDFLAKFGARQEDLFVVMSSPLEGMVALMFADVMGVSFVRT